MTEPYRVYKGKPRPTKLRIKRKVVLAPSDVAQRDVRKAPAEWGCEEETPSHLNQDLAFMYASRRLLEEITRTLYHRRVSRLS